MQVMYPTVLATPIVVMCPGIVLCTVQELKIARTAKEVHEGLQFLYRSRAASNGQKPVWHSDLGRLSGGERTLVSLALILAVCPLHMHYHVHLQDSVHQVTVSVCA